MTSEPFRPRVNLFGERCREDLEFNLNEEGEDTHAVYLSFKRLGEKKDEPFLNRLCVWATSSSRDVLPGGRMSHVEIMFKNNGKWWRFSIVKATRRTNEDGSYTWEPGKVHCKLVRSFDMNRYDFYKIFAPRTLQLHAWNFLQSQVGGEFNTNGYMFNFVSPIALWGTTGKKDIDRELAAYATIGDVELGQKELDYKNATQRKWFCSELVCTGLQFLDLRRFMNKKACLMSPNEMYRICLKEYGLPTMNPVVTRFKI